MVINGEIGTLKELIKLEVLIDQIKNNPNSRRMIVSAWNPSVLPDTSKSFTENVKNGKAALPPCHAFFNFMLVKENCLVNCIKEALTLF